MGNVFISIFLINTSNDVMGALLYNLFIAIMILAGFFIKTTKQIFIEVMKER